MDLNEILIFTRVVETGSFTAAAKKLGMPKSTVSRKVSALEERLGVRLLHRTTRQLRLTDVGETFHASCADIIGALVTAERAVTETQASPKGRLRVTAPVDFAVQVLPPLLRGFRTRYPDVEIDLDLSGKVVDLVADGFDVAVRASAQLPDSSLIARKLGVTRMHLVASPAYLKRAGRPGRPDQLPEHSFILRHRQRRTLQFEGPAGNRKIVISGSLSVNELGMIRKLVLQDLGIATLPDVLCCKDLSEGRLVHLLPAWTLPQTGIYAVYPSARHLSAPVRAFIDFLKAEMSPRTWQVGRSEVDGLDV
ncbi:MAG: LysR family transcriptional regulator [Myxococcales bacterium]|nr:LysR family transcriptional regulator [Myxococcales bacterium]